MCYTGYAVSHCLSFCPVPAQDSKVSSLLKWRLQDSTAVFIVSVPENILPLDKFTHLSWFAMTW